jgi:hypothetical protein
MLEYFCAHPRSVGETYFQHMRQAVTLGVVMIAAGVAAIIHGFCPPVFTTTASDCARRVVANVDGRLQNHEKITKK